jgi:3-hydroxyacyl-CoA dehydrogenase
MAMIRQSIDEVSKNFKALVIYNEGTNFSAGANIGLALFTANVALWPLIYQMIAEGQQTYKALKYAPFPVVSAPSGMALGGGCEVLLHSTAVQAHAESYIGLVEVGVGLIPAWGGCKELVTRWMTNHQRPGGALVAIGKVFETIGMAKVAKSAAEAREFLYLRPEDGITMNRDRLLADAKAKALSMVKNYNPPEPQELSLPGSTARTALLMAVKALVKIGKASPYDEEISKKLAFVLTGGAADITDKQTEDQLYKLEFDAFMMLIKNPKTLERIEHMLETGKPLRN